MNVSTHTDTPLSYTFILPNSMFKNPEAAKCSVGIKRSGV